MLQKKYFLVNLCSEMIEKTYTECDMRARKINIHVSVPHR